MSRTELLSIDFARESQASRIPAGRAKGVTSRRPGFRSRLGKRPPAGRAHALAPARARPPAHALSRAVGRLAPAPRGSLPFSGPRAGNAVDFAAIARFSAENSMFEPRAAFPNGNRARAARDRSIFRKKIDRAPCDRLSQTGIAPILLRSTDRPKKSRSRGVQPSFPPGKGLRAARDRLSQPESPTEEDFPDVKAMAVARGEQPLDREGVRRARLR